MHHAAQYRRQTPTILHVKLVVTELQLAKQVQTTQRPRQCARQEVVVQLQRTQRSEAPHCIGYCASQSSHRQPDLGHACVGAGHRCIRAALHGHECATETLGLLVVLHNGCRGDSRLQ